MHDFSDAIFPEQVTVDYLTVSSAVTSLISQQKEHDSADIHTELCIVTSHTS